MPFDGVLQQLSASLFVFGLPIGEFVMVHISSDWLFAAGLLIVLVGYARWLQYAETKRYRK